MSRTHLPTDGNPRSRVVHSDRVTPVAQLAEAAPIAPPQNLEAEESVLGAMLLSPGAIGAVSEVLDASDFYRESHAKIYRAGLALYAKGEPVHATALVDELEERSELEAVGGRVRMHELAALVPATANAAHYARIVREMAPLRGLIAAGQQIAQLGWERPGETQILVDRAEQVVFDLSQSRVSTEFSHIEELLKESFERITALYEAGADVTGVPSGFRDLDRLTSGFQPGNLVIIAARPSMGKSALGLCVAANLALRHEIPVALFTLARSELSRAVDHRRDKRPILSDLGESGCLTGDSRVSLPDEGIYRPISELVGRSGFRVSALNQETWRLESRVVTNAFATGRKPVYRLRTRLGRTIRATGNHKFLSFSGWRRPGDPGPGGRVALPRPAAGPWSPPMRGP